MIFFLFVFTHALSSWRGFFVEINKKVFIFIKNYEIMRFFHKIARRNGKIRDFYIPSR